MYNFISYIFEVLMYNNLYFDTSHASEAKVATFKNIFQQTGVILNFSIDQGWEFQTHPKLLT